MSVDTSVKEIASFTRTRHNRFKMDVVVSVPHPHNFPVQRLCENGNMIALGVESSLPGEESLHVALPFFESLSPSS